MHITLENFVQRGYPIVTEFLKVEDKCTTANEPVENSVNAKTDLQSSAAGNINLSAAKVLFCLIIIVAYASW